jgi:hypothetical protein
MEVALVYIQPDGSGIWKFGSEWRLRESIISVLQRWIFAGSLVEEIPGSCLINEEETTLYYKGSVSVYDENKEVTFRIKVSPLFSESAAEVLLDFYDLISA